MLNNLHVHLFFFCCYSEDHIIWQATSRTPYTRNSVIFKKIRPFYLIGIVEFRSFRSRMSQCLFLFNGSPMILVRDGSSYLIDMPMAYRLEKIKARDRYHYCRFVQELNWLTTRWHLLQRAGNLRRVKHQAGAAWLSPCHLYWGLKRSTDLPIL